MTVQSARILPMILKYDVVVDKQIGRRTREVGAAGGARIEGSR